VSDDRVVLEFVRVPPGQGPVTGEPVTGFFLAAAWGFASNDTRRKHPDEKTRMDP
jgi:hypothetical protein